MQRMFIKIFLTLSTFISLLSLFIPYHALPARDLATLDTRHPRPPTAWFSAPREVGLWVASPPNPPRC